MRHRVSSFSLIEQLSEIMYQRESFPCKSIKLHAVNNPQGFRTCEGAENLTLSSSACLTSGAGIHSQTLWYNLSVLRDKVQPVRSLVSLLVSPDPIQQESVALAASGAGAVIQQAAVGAVPANSGGDDISHPHDMKASYEGSAQPNGAHHIDHVLDDLEVGRMGIFGAAAHYSTN